MYVVDSIQNTTASVCNHVQINNGNAIFQPATPVPFIQLLNIIELSDVTSFTVVTWVTLNQNNNFTAWPLFSFGDIRFPALSSDVYELQGCYEENVVLNEMTKMPLITNYEGCLQYAKSNLYNYFAYGSFCRSATRIKINVN